MLEWGRGWDGGRGGEAFGDVPVVFIWSFREPGGVGGSGCDGDTRIYTTECAEALAVYPGVCQAVRIQADV